MGTFKYFLIIIFPLVLCENAFSQGTFLLGDRSLSLVSSYSFPHGFGAEPLSHYNRNASFKKACASSLEELNSNLFISVYMEQFKTGANTNYSFPELSVRDTVLSYGNEIVKVDSFDVGGQAYCISSLKQSHNHKVEAIPNLEKLKIGPIKQTGIWYAMGVEKGSRYNPYISWIKSKNVALQDLTQTITTLVQSSIINLDFSLAELTYFKSNIIYNDIVVAQRFISSENEFVSIIAVNEEDIIEY